jgi:2-desacetyl-2-hydroxyethyl bacteriochlorophyllide A dehydrogenase
VSLTRRRAVFFTGPGRVEVREEPLPDPAPGLLAVRSLASAVSAGTELLFYRGEVPADMSVDPAIPGLAGRFAWPMKYGYAAVGEVTACGSAELESWLGRRVFAFHPHESAFLASPSELIAVPEGIAPDQAVFLPNMETAVCLVSDAAPLIGEQVAVLGQGVVGLLAVALLAHFPLSSLVASDVHALRRSTSLVMGATAVIDASASDARIRVREALAGGRGADGADLCLELTGSPAALADAIEVTGFEGRIVIGSWYGTKSAPVPLGGSFHRSRIRIVSSQVSTIASGLRGRWNAEGRISVAWQWIRNIGPVRLVTHRFPVDRAAEAYALLAGEPGRALQVLITY